MLANRTSGAAAAPAPAPALAKPPICATALRREIGDADDEKISKIIAYVDQVGDAEINRTLLDTLRSRVASLRPKRPLRLSRLLFMPLDPLIVSPASWRPGSLRVPRTALAPFFALVAGGFGPDLAAITTMVEGQTSHSEAAANSGTAVWPRAAAILRKATPPPEWQQTALPETVFWPLARSIAAVLHRGSALHRLTRNALSGQTEEDAELVGSLFTELATETAETAGMVLQLVLFHAPQAIVHVRRLVSATPDSAERVLLHQAFSLGLEGCLSYVERDANCVRKVGAASIRETTAEVKLVARLLNAIDNDSSGVLHRRRIRMLRDQMDQASQACFANGLREALVRPLTGLTQMASVAEQNRMEASARELRALEGAARQFSSAVSYDHHLLQTSQVVRAAFAAGTIGLARACRLLEIICGPEQAVALYRSHIGLAQPNAAPGDISACSSPSPAGGRGSG